MSNPWKRRMFPDPLTDAIFAYCIDVAGPSKFLQGTSNFCGNLADYLREHGFAVPVQRPSSTPTHRSPDFVDSYGIARYVCECGTVVGLHEFGRHVDCEYYRHHCDSCHERGACTAHDDEACPDCEHFGEHGAECQWLGR